MDKNKIALVDDHTLFRDGLLKLINDFKDFKVVIEADNGQDFIDKLSKAETPDIVLLDISMKGMDGFETAEWLRVNRPEIKILALSMYDNENAVIRMLRLGAKGYILKDIRKHELHEALLSILNKGFYYSEMITGKLIHAINSFDDKEGGHNLKELISLNEREIEFLKLACSELTYKEIASKMSLSPHTIDGYRDSLFEKLNIKSRVGLVLYAIKNNIFHLDKPD